MRRFKSVFLFIMLMPLCFFLRSCFSESYTYVDFLIKVDSIRLPDTLASNIPFDIEFFGTIGWNGCNSFKVFDQSVKNNDITIGAWGTYENKNGLCPSVMVYLDGKKLNMTIPLPGIYKIKIIEPDNSSIVQQVTMN